MSQIANNNNSIYLYSTISHCTETFYKQALGNSSWTRVTFCHFLKLNIIIYNITFSNPSCVLLEIRVLYNVAQADIYLIKYYAFNYN